jgi:AcrR family transcriptional regulator
LSASEAQRGPRVERRASRRALSRIEILDVAETLFDGHGACGNLPRKIAALSGFSRAALDCFFEDKQHLFTETPKGRAEELAGDLKRATDRHASPLDELRRMTAVSDRSVAETFSTRRVWKPQL